MKVWYGKRRRKWAVVAIEHRQIETEQLLLSGLSE
jgi:hypothetical protein